jgi:hypothetical protein
MSSLKHTDITQVVVRLWAIWYARRLAIHENQFQSPLSTHSFVERFIGELKAVKQESPGGSKSADTDGGATGDVLG